MTIIIGLSARKQGGKGTLSKCLVDNAESLFGPGATVKVYSMAGQLKLFCHRVLGLTHEQCYGSDADKNTLTRYHWEKMPHYPRLLDQLRAKLRRELEADLATKNWFVRLCHRVAGSVDTWVENDLWLNAPTGPMTARQVLQEVGTGVVRQMWGDVWNQACLAEIRRDNPDVAAIDDIRFPDEADAVRAAGGKVFRLHRAPFKGHDTHVSETMMDDYPHFDGHVHNDRLGISESCVVFRSLLDSHHLTAPWAPCHD